MEGVVEGLLYSILGGEMSVCAWFHEDLWMSLEGVRAGSRIWSGSWSGSGSGEVCLGELEIADILLDVPFSEEQGVDL